MAKSFKVGEMAVYPAQGVAEIQGIETLEIAGIVTEFYMLRCLDSEKKIRVPVNNVEQVGLRELVKEAEIQEALELLRIENVAIEEPNWNRRHRRYIEKIQTGEFKEMAQVLRDLHLTRREKQLSYGERRVYETTMQLLIQELAVAKSLPEDEVATELEQILD